MNTKKSPPPRGSVFVLGIASAEIFFLPGENAIFSAILPPAAKVEHVRAAGSGKKETKRV
jgi:hypothetical protein